jgi:inorganic triphosphatase YgiF
MSNIERELKLTPDDASLLERLGALEQLGEFVVKRRRRELQRNSFFDTRSRVLRRAHVGFRRRTVQGQPLATWTLKAADDGDEVDRAAARGVATRTEIELQLDADMPPGVALAALRTTARQRGAALLADQIDDALAQREPPLGQPFVESETDRIVEDLEAAGRGWDVELALDRVRLIGHTYSELEIEVELKRGDEGALESARQAIAQLGTFHESRGSKLSRALAHLESCHCETLGAEGTGEPRHQRL